MMVVRSSQNLRTVTNDLENGGGRPLVALVLAGGGARGAYEVGVVRYIVDELPKRLGRDIPLDILCGTSVGAINACMLASFADAPRLRGKLLVDRWRALQVEQILQPDPLEFITLVRELFGGRPRPFMGKEPRGGLVNPAGLTQVLTDAIPFNRIEEHVNSGRLLALSVSTTHVGTGRTVVFVQHHDSCFGRWGTHHAMSRRATKIELEHAMASAAIPFVFPAVNIDGELYCDGGLRQNVPLSPARRLGADRLLVVNPHYLGPTEEKIQKDREESFAGPAFLLGKTLNALLLDRLDGDVERLGRINEILAAGTREYGEGFAEALNRQMGLGSGPAGLRKLRTVVIRASQDIGRLCGDFVRGPAFARSRKGLTGRALRRLARAEGMEEADLLSYILFDGEFAGELIALGEADAKAREDELLSFFEDVVRADATT
jgi:NTE family protein